MADLYPLYMSLRDLMVRAAPNMKIGKEISGEITLNVPTATMQAKDPVWFGTVRLTANNAAYYLPPLAMKEGRELSISDALKKRSQSKTCFIFHDVEPGLFAELEAITQAVAKAF